MTEGADSSVQELMLLNASIPHSEETDLNLGCHYASKEIEAL